MTRLAWRMLWQRPAGVVATFLALSLAVAVVTCCGVLLESGARFHGPTNRYAAAPILVATTDISVATGSGADREIESNGLAERGHVDPSLTARIGAVTGVRAAVADVAVAGQLLEHGTAAAIQAHPWSAAQLAPFTLRSGSAPTAGEVVLDQRLASRSGVRPGRAVRLAFASGVRTLTVSGVVASVGPGSADPTVFVDDAAARSLSDQVDAIGVLPRPGVDVTTLAAAVNRALPSDVGRPDGAYPRVYVGSDRGDVETVGVAAGREFVIAVSAAAGGVTLLIAVLVIAGSVGLSVSQRRRDIALLRAVAATPRQVRRMVVRELVAVGTLAAAAGTWPGLHATHWLRDQLVSHGLVPDTFTIHVSWLPPVVAASATVLVAIVAGWIASLRASRIRPTEALAETSVERAGVGVARAALGVLTLAGGITLAVVAGSGSGSLAASVMVPAVFLFVASVGCWSPFIIRVSAATVGRLFTVFGVTGQLAVANAAASARRLSAVISSLVLAVALGGSMWFLPASQQHAADRQSHAGLLADYVIKPAAPGLAPSAVAKLAHVTGVVAATGIVHSTLFSPKGDFSQFTALGADPDTLARTVDLGVSSGSIAGLRGNTIAVDRLAARALGLHVGSRFQGWFGDGSPAELRVVAVYTRGLGFAELTVPSDVLRAHTTSGLDDAVLVKAASDQPRLAAALGLELERLAPGSSVRSASAYRSEADKNNEQNTWSSQLIAAVLLGYAVIASINTLVMAGLARRREFAVLRLAGTTRRQVLRMVRFEQLLLLGIALVLGTAIAASTLVPTVRGLTGSAVPYIPPAGWLGLVGGSALLAAAGMLPVRRVLRARPVVAIGVRE